MKPVFVLAGQGIHCETETAHAYALAGLRAEIVPLAELFEGVRRLTECSLLHLPGGFSHGDHLGAGLVLADQIRHGRLPAGGSFFEELCRFVDDGGHLVGVCNGFQVLVRAGLLPNVGGGFETEAALLVNARGSFENRWVHVRGEGPFASLGQLELPVRHGEGRLVFVDAARAHGMLERGRILLRYVTPAGDSDPSYPENPNGSWLGAAGLCDATGRILGLMPHPEAFLWAEHHPAWARSPRAVRPDGLRFFEALAQRVRETQTGKTS